MAPLDSVGDSVNLCVGRKGQPLNFKLKMFIFCDPEILF